MYLVHETKNASHVDVNDMRWKAGTNTLGTLSVRIYGTFRFYDYL